MRLEFDVPDAILHELLDRVNVPDMALVSYRQPTPPAIDDVAGTVFDGMQSCRALSAVKPGQRIAVAVGSRGIDRLPEIVRAVVDEIRRHGGRPFIVPAMGSHGGATAEGQRAVLRHLGVTEESVGAPIRSEMPTVVVGRTEEGMPVHMDRLAAQADGICVVARIKRHTAFHGPYESGMAKMLAIGLGKQAGAAIAHAQGFGVMAATVPLMAAVVLREAPILCAVAVIENARDELIRLEVVTADRIMEVEPEMLAEAAGAMPRIPFSQLDVLVIDEIGKDISGDGADPNVTGRYPTPFASGGPAVTRQVVLDLTDATDGNGNGIGTADFTTARTAKKIDLGRTYPNALTSTVPGPVKLPMILPSDRLAIAAALLTCNAVGRSPRLMRIKNTLRLSRFWVTANLLEEVTRDPHLDVLEAARPVAFDAHGNLLDLSHETAGLLPPWTDYDVG